MYMHVKVRRTLWRSQASKSLSPYISVRRRTVNLSCSTT